MFFHVGVCYLGILATVLMAPLQALEPTVIVVGAGPTDAARRSNGQGGTAAAFRGPLARDFSNQDLEGGDLSLLPDMDRRVCAATCETDAECLGYAYDKWNRWCYLKSSLGKLRADPKYHTGIRRDLPEPPRMTTRVVMERYRNKAFPYSGQPTRLATSFKDCQKHCSRSSNCLAVTYFKRTKRCWMMEETPNQYVSDPNANIAVKRQEPPQR